jgi:hypothetical protein
MITMFLALYLRAAEVGRSRDRGQGTLEYVGMVAVAALLVAGVVGAFGGGDAITGVVERAVARITEIG